MLLNECLLHFYFMCVIMMVFNVCVNDTVQLLHISVSKTVCDELCDSHQCSND